MVKRKKYMDIERVKDETELSKSNKGGFIPGDYIVIQEKVDGANASFAYETETDSLVAFSRNNELTISNDLRGYYNFVQKLDVAPYRKYPNYIFFMEWLVSHTVTYKQDAYNKAYLFDIYDRVDERYLTQDKVNELAKELGLNQVKTYYSGEFTTWDEVYKYADRQSDISEKEQEGIVVKNMTALAEERTLPAYLKIVNASFREVQRSHHKQKVEDPMKIAARAKAMEIAQQIITENRVKKLIYKLIDEGILPSELTSKDMADIAKLIPDLTYQDCLKEEKEAVESAGEFFSGACKSLSMNFARKIVLG